MIRYDRTGIGRTIDLRLASNRLAVGGGLLGTLLAVILQWINGESISILVAGAMGVGVFLAWAIARELDPDHPTSATIAVVIATGAIAFGPFAAGAVAVAMLAARVMTGTVGARLRPADVVVLSGAAAYAGTRPEAWGAAALLIASVLVARPPRAGAIAAAFALSTIVGAVLTGATPGPSAFTPLTIALIAATVIATAISYPARRLTSYTDAGRNPIDTARVSMARVGMASAIVMGSVLGAEGAQALAPAIAALVGVAMIRLTSPGPRWNRTTNRSNQQGEVTEARREVSDRPAQTVSPPPCDPSRPRKEAIAVFPAERDLHSRLPKLGCRRPNLRG